MRALGLILQMASCLVMCCLVPPVMAQPGAPLPAYATLYVGGNYFFRGTTPSKYVISSGYADRELALKGTWPAAGLATFGWFESGEVKLLLYAEYVPALAHAGARRNVKPPKGPLEPQATPRYAMVCAWPLDDRRAPGKPAAAYAERDDANIEVKKSPSGTLLSVRWVSIPPARAAKNFAAKDYCGEIARTKQSSAPLWLTTTTE